MDKLILELDKDKIIELVTEYAKSKGYDVTKVEVEIRMKSVAFQMSVPSDEPMLEGMKVHCTKE